MKRDMVKTPHFDRQAILLLIAAAKHPITINPTKVRLGFGSGWPGHQ
jgi:hypothetical protein